MKTLNNYIIEKLKITKNTKVITYKYFPKNRNELRDILEERLREDKDANLNDIDVSKITNMSDLFNGLDAHNIDISKWDVSNVKDMSGMFYWCKYFNCDLSNWNVSNVKTMESMFSFCYNFNCDLSNWNVSKVKKMWDMFKECKSLKNKPSWYK